MTEGHNKKPNRRDGAKIENCCQERDWRQHQEVRHVAEHGGQNPVGEGREILQASIQTEVHEEVIVQNSGEASITQRSL